MWLPDTYEGSPTPIGALLAAGTKKAGFAAAIKVVVIGTFALGNDWGLILGILAVVTMTVGNLAALRQKKCNKNIGIFKYCTSRLYLNWFSCCAIF